VDQLRGGDWEIATREDWRAAPADAYLYEGDVLSAAELLIEMREAGVRAPLLGGPMLARSQLPQIASDAVRGACHAVTAPAYVERAPSFDEDVRQLGGVPGPWALLAYDATNLLLDALRQEIESAGGPSRDGVAAALEQLRGPDGQLVFEGRRRRQAEVSLYCYQAGDSYPGTVMPGR
jgi:ABC-type branched-subunit amino acid transport system substrate-binding protein